MPHQFYINYLNLLQKTWLVLEVLGNKKNLSQNLLFLNLKNSSARSRNNVLTLTMFWPRENKNLKTLKTTLLGCQRESKKIKIELNKSLMTDVLKTVTTLKDLNTTSLLLNSSSSLEHKLPIKNLSVQLKEKLSERVSTISYQFTKLEITLNLSYSKNNSLMLKITPLRPTKMSMTEAVNKLDLVTLITMKPKSMLKTSITDKEKVGSKLRKNYQNSYQTQNNPSKKRWLKLKKMKSMQVLLLLTTKFNSNTKSKFIKKILPNGNKSSFN